MSSRFSGKSLPVQASGESDVSEEEVACTGHKKKKLSYQGPLAKLVTIDRFAAYAGFTTGAIRKMCIRGILPAHQMKNPNNPEGKGTWYINRDLWDKLSEQLPKIEPQEWHSWKDYWMYDRKASHKK
ncbi:Cox family DNA-binding protein [Arsenophonus nasoniae]|uniref:Cox family DNA-binding protein n=1 Tax=Arsenophonus nasoniae TaxID=638 RepID=UPI003879FDD4